jgi:hypothetical protein
MSQMSREDLRALRWHLLGYITDIKAERDFLHKAIKNVNKELFIRNEPQ